MSISSETPKFCKNCAHLIGLRHYPEHNSGDWKCGAPENIKGLDLVTGANLLYYKDCYEARLVEDTRCGLSGKWYVEYTPPKHIERNELPVDPMQPGGRKRMKLTATDLDNL
jgi:hypothetical protein